MNIEAFATLVLSLLKTELSRKNINVDHFTQLYIHTMSFSVKIYKASELADLVHDNLLKLFLEVASIPWLHSIDPPWFDFKPVTHDEATLLGFNRTLKKPCHSKLIGRSLKLISLLGKHLPCSTWLSHVFRVALVCFRVQNDHGD